MTFLRFWKASFAMTYPHGINGRVNSDSSLKKLPTSFRNYVLCFFHSYTCYVFYVVTFFTILYHRWVHKSFSHLFFCFIFWVFKKKIFFFFTVIAFSLCISFLTKYIWIGLALFLLFTFYFCSHGTLIIYFTLVFILYFSNVWDRRHSFLLMCQIHFNLVFSSDIFFSLYFIYLTLPPKGSTFSSPTLGCPGLNCR